MNRPLKALAVRLLPVVMTVWMTACSKDLPTGPTQEPYTGAPQAQVPANDDFDNATVITTLPFIDNQNTTEATTEADEPADPNDPAVCFVGGHTVWYQFTPSVDMRINANTFGSDYDTGIAVFTSTNGDLSFVLCNDDAVTGQFVQSNLNFDAVAGTTYYFMVGSCCNSDGGNLVFRVDESVELGLTIDPTGSVNASTGEVTISGTITCAEPVSGTLDGFIRQRFGRFFVTGGFFTFFECDEDEVTSWQVQVVGDNGLFAGGRVEVTANAFAFDQDFIQVSTTVRLRGQGK
jgi:hypothetical protein